jgi:hypothetical protein
MGQVTAVTYAEHVAGLLRLLRSEAEEVQRARARLIDVRDRHAGALRFEAAAQAQRDLEQLDRLLRRQRTLGWIVAHQHFLVLQPSVSPDAAMAYVVIGGQLVERALIREAAQLAALRARVRETLAERGMRRPSAADIDGSTILAAWLRDRGERDGFVFRVGENDAASQLNDWEAALSTILANARAPASHRGGTHEDASPPEPHPDRDEQHR